MGPQTSARSLPHPLPWFAYFLYFCYLLRDICLLTLLDPRGYWGRGQGVLPADTRYCDHRRTPVFSKHADRSPVDNAHLRKTWPIQDVRFSALVHRAALEGFSLPGDGPCSGAESHGSRAAFRPEPAAGLPGGRLTQPRALMQ